MPPCLRASGPAALAVAALMLLAAGPAGAQETDLRIRPEELALPTITVGDTIETVLTIENRGRLEVTVREIRTPHPSLVVVTTLPFRLERREERTVRLRWTPRTPLQLDGDLVIVSSIVLPHEDRVEVDGEALGLGFRLDLPSGPVTEGTPVTATVQPDEGVRIERGTLYHRRLGDTAFAALPLVRSGGVLRATVPGEAVRQPGLQLYVEVENSGIFAREPASAPTALRSLTVEPPPRPRIVLSTSRLDLPAVTVGDTARADLVVRNDGTGTLRIESFEAPSALVGLSPAPPLEMAPGTVRTLVVRYAPVVAGSLSGSLVLVGNDPDNPRASLPITGTARALAFTTALPPPSAALTAGQPMTVTVAPAAGVRIESGAVLHRRRGDTLWASAPLVPQGVGFTATVPGSGVQPPALELYVRVENSGILAFDPAGAPASFHSRTVAPPPAPNLTLSVTSLALPAVTLGDTASVAFSVGNSGSDDLHLGGSELPSGMWLQPPLPAVVQPNRQLGLTLRFAPSRAGDTAAALVLLSDDPDSARSRLPVSARALALAYATELVGVGEEAAPLQPITARVVPAAGVRLETVRLYHRVVGTATYDSLTLARQPSGNLTGVIPGAAVRAAGLQYWVRARNSGFTAVDPPGAPQQVHLQQVAPEPRPILSLSTASFPLGDVTVGDTASFGFTIRNGGTAPLRVQQVQLPAGQLRLVGRLSSVLQPMQRDSLTILFEPLVGETIQGSVVIVSDDPQQPQLSLPLSARGRSLQFTASTDVGAQAPLGLPVRVLVSPAFGVRIEQGLVYLRTTGGGAFTTTVPLVREGTGWVATIPGWRVTEPGLDWYVEVQNSGIRATEPAGAPAQFRTQAVRPPSGVVALPDPGQGDAFPAAAPVRIQVYLPSGTVARSGRLHFRRGGESAYRSTDLDVSASPLAGQIPDSLVGPRGLEYWVEVSTLTSTITGPPTQASQRPYTLAVTVPRLVEPSRRPARAYRLLSVPLQPPPGFTGTLADLLSGREGFGAYGSPRWRAFRYLPGDTTYLELGRPGTATHFRPVPGRAYWVVTGEDHRAGSGVAALSVPTDSSCAVVLEPGWNQVGAPFLFPVAWADCRVDGMSAPAAENVLVEAPVAWRPGEGYVPGVQTLQPFEGYWIRNLTSAPRVLRIPPREASPVRAPAGLLAGSPGAPGSAGAAPPSAPAADGSWRVTVAARSAGRADLHNAIAVHPDALPGWDRHDRAEPPPAPDGGLQLSFPQPGWGERAGRYAVDARGQTEPLAPLLAAALPAGLAAAGQALPAAALPGARGHLWRLDVAKGFADRGPADEVVLSFAGLEAVPPELEIWLIDRDLARAVDLRQRPEYRFLLGRREAADSPEHCRFLLLAGEPGYADGTREDLALPAAVALRAARPNPSNPSTVIGLDLPAPARVELRVYDVRGGLVRTLLAGELPAGRHERAWHGEDERGRAMASGVYFYRLQTDDGFRQTRKLVLVR